MIIKLLGQLVFASMLVYMLPADLSQFEMMAGVEVAPSTGFEQNYLPTASARQLELRDYPVKVDPNSYGVVTSAQSVIVEDAKSGMMMLGKHPDYIRSIGSVTKLMTALVFLDQNPDLDQIVELDPTLDLIQGGRVYLAFYDGLSLDDVLGASLVGSDNTATESLMRFSGLENSVFIEKMNEKAKELGMSSTSFVDPTGISALNTSTARDVVKLLRSAKQNEIVQDYMVSKDLSVRHTSGRVITLKNTNKVLDTFLNEGEYQVTSGKTGFLPQAGYVLATSIERGEDEVYVVVLGSESKDTRVLESKGLAAWAFKTFSWPE